MLRSRQLFAWMAALAVLLHTATAAASIFCAMTGTVSVSCGCPKGEAQQDGPVLRGVDSCCSEVVDEPQVNLHDLSPLPIPMAAHPWEQIVLPIPRALVATQAPVPCCTSPPLERLATTVIIR